jgi:fatty-acyl-CoA synthase
VSTLYRGPTYADLIVSSLERHSDRTFLSLEGRDLTYGDAKRVISQLVQALADLGMTKGTGFAVLSGNRPDAFFTVAAALILGCRYTTLNPFGSVEEHLFVLDDGEIDTLVIDPRAYEQHAARLLDSSPGVQRVLSLGPSSLSADDLLAAANRYSPSTLCPVPAEGDLAIVQYTSGTTGRPKGVMLSHRAMAHGVLLTTAQWEWPREVRFLALTQLAQPLLVPVMMRGGMAVLESGLDPAVILRAIERERITATYAVPALIYGLLDHPGRESIDTSSLELLIYASSPIAPSRLAEAIDSFGPIFMQVYGQTEALFVTMLDRSSHDTGRTDRLCSCGTPLAGNEVRVLDEDHREVAVGEIGEICVRGRVVMDGYWNQPDLTAASVRDDWLHTGDLAHRDADGFISIVDRRRDTIDSGGTRVFSRQIEDILSTHGSVAAAAVFGIPDEAEGEAVIAVVALRPGCSSSPDELIEFVEARKGGAHAPRAVEIVETMPLTAAGKPNKQALRRAVSPVG